MKSTMVHNPYATLKEFAFLFLDNSSMRFFQMK